MAKRLGYFENELTILKAISELKSNNVSGAIKCLSQLDKNLLNKMDFQSLVELYNQSKKHGLVSTQEVVREMMTLDYMTTNLWKKPVGEKIIWHGPSMNRFYVEGPDDCLTTGISNDCHSTHLWKAGDMKKNGETERLEAFRELFEPYFTDYCSNLQPNMRVMLKVACNLE